MSLFYGFDNNFDIHIMHPSNRSESNKLIVGRDNNPTKHLRLSKFLFLLTSI